ncbi:MAG: RDD family protein [Burkholderiaceae bacterium]
MTGADGEPAREGAPGLLRRMACFVYEGMLLFGLSLIPGAVGALYLAASARPATPASDAVLRAFTLLLFGAYFVHFWSTRGQTLPMQTWHIRVVGPDGLPPRRARAVARFLAACLWFAPASLIAAALGWNRWQALTAVAAGIVAWALLALLHPQRQFWHDALCRTRLLTARPPARRT